MKIYLNTNTLVIKPLNLSIGGIINVTKRNW